MERIKSSIVWIVNDKNDIYRQYINKNDNNSEKIKILK